MSDTPRTDKARGFFDMETAVDADEMEKLERENNALRAALIACYEEMKYSILTSQPIQEDRRELSMARKALGID